MTISIKTIFLIIVLTSLFDGFSQKVSNDTIVLKKGEMDSIRNKVFIDPNKNSLYYKPLLDFGISNKSESLAWSYELLMDSSRGRKPKINKTAGLPKKWVPLHLYKNNYYIYSPCDGINNYRFLISDSLVFEWDAMGPEVREYNSFKKVNDSTYINKETSYFREECNLTIIIINRQKGIAVFATQDINSHKTDYYLMVQINKIKLFPIIKNYCRGGKEREFHFDKPDYQKLLGQK